MTREPFVSGVYRAEEDERNKPKPSIQTICNEAIKGRKRRRFYSSPSTPATVAATKRMLGEKEDD